MAISATASEIDHEQTGRAKLHTTQEKYDELRADLEGEDSYGAARKIMAKASSPGEAVKMAQMGAADRVGGLAIGIVVVGIVLNEMNNLSMVNDSNSVIDVSGILETAGSGLDLLTLAIIALAAGVILTVFRNSF